MSILRGPRCGHVKFHRWRALSKLHELWQADALGFEECLRADHRLLNSYSIQDVHGGVDALPLAPVLVDSDAEEDEEEEEEGDSVEHFPFPERPEDERYIAASVATTGSKSVLLTSHGSAIAIGYNDEGQCDVPLQPEGERYISRSGHPPGDAHGPPSEARHAKPQSTSIHVMYSRELYRECTTQLRTEYVCSDRCFGCLIA